MRTTFLYSSIALFALLLVLLKCHSGGAPDDGGNDGFSDMAESSSGVEFGPRAGDFPPPLPVGAASAPDTANRPPPLPTGAGRGQGAPISPPPLPRESSDSADRARQSLHLRRTRIMDHQGFERSMPALHLLIPADWQESGEVVWSPWNTCQPEVRQFQWRALAPDGTAGIEFLPAEGWGMSSMVPGGLVGCRQGDLRSIRAYLEQVARARRPGARLTGFRDFSDDLVELNTQVAQTALQVPGMRDHRRIEAGELSLEYVDNGRRMRELLFAAGFFGETHWSTGESTLIGIVAAPLAVAYFASEASFDLRLVEAIGQTMRADPDWEAKITELDARIAGTTMEEMKKRHQINMDTINYIGGLNRSSYNDRMASQERTGHAFNQTIRGVQTWSDPSSGGESFELPLGFGNAWRLDDDTFILTDNADFHPYSALGMRGRKLERAR